MSSKTNLTTKIVLGLTILGCVIPTVYVNLFSDSFLLYHRVPTNYSIAGIGGLLCIFGALVGFAGTFEKKVCIIDRGICIVCTLFCLAFILYVLAQTGAAREKPKRIACSSNLRQIYMALKQYAADYAGNYPPASGTAGLEILRRNDYMPEYALYTCPSTETVCGKNSQSLTEENTDYVYIGGLNTNSDRNLLLLYDKANNHGYYGNVLFADGIIQGIEGDPWTKNIKK